MLKIISGDYTTECQKGGR